MIKEEVINKEGSWAYFDEASQGASPIGGVGDILHLFDSHWIKFKAGLGHPQIIKQNY